jgi:hypothetical protein
MIASNTTETMFGKLPPAPRHRAPTDREPAQADPPLTDADVMLDHALEDTFPASDPVSSNLCD